MAATQPLRGTVLTSLSLDGHLNQTRTQDLLLLSNLGTPLINHVSLERRTPPRSHHTYQPSPQTLKRHDLLHRIDRLNVHVLADLVGPTYREAVATAKCHQFNQFHQLGPHVRVGKYVHIADRKSYWPAAVLGFSLNPARALRALLAEDPLALPGLEYVGPRTVSGLDSNSLHPHDLLGVSPDPGSLLRGEQRWLAQVVPQILHLAQEAFDEIFSSRVVRDPRIYLRSIELASDWPASHGQRVDTAVRSSGCHAPRQGILGPGWVGHVRTRGPERAPTKSTSTIRGYKKDPRYIIDWGYTSGPGGSAPTTSTHSVTNGASACALTGASIVSPPPAPAPAVSGAEPPTWSSLGATTPSLGESLGSTTFRSRLIKAAAETLALPLGAPRSRGTSAHSQSRTSLLASGNAPPTCGSKPGSCATASSFSGTAADSASSSQDDQIVRVEARFGRRALDRELRGREFKDRSLTRELLRHSDFCALGPETAAAHVHDKLREIVCALRSVTEPLDRMVAITHSSSGGQIGELLLALTGYGGAVLFEELIHAGRISTGPTSHSPSLRIGPRHLARARDAEVVVATKIRGVYELHPRFEDARWAILGGIDSDWPAIELCRRLLALELNPKQLRKLVDMLGQGGALPRPFLRRVGKLQRWGMVGRTGRATTKWASHFAKLRDHLQLCDCALSDDPAMYAALLDRMEPVCWPRVSSPATTTQPRAAETIEEPEQLQPAAAAAVELPRRRALVGLRPFRLGQRATRTPHRPRRWRTVVRRVVRATWHHGQLPMARCPRGPPRRS